MVYKVSTNTVLALKNKILSSFPGFDFELRPVGISVANLFCIESSQYFKLTLYKLVSYQKFKVILKISLFIFVDVKLNMPKYMLIWKIGGFDIV